jgi:L-asparaginase
MNNKPSVAVISTGGTITSISGLGELDLFEYSATGTRLDANETMAMFPQGNEVADIIPVPFEALLSTAISFPHWKRLAQTIENLVKQYPALSGIVILHGTSAMEETAYALSLTLTVDVPVVVTGSQRPASALSTDAGMNIYNAVRVAACPEARGLGVLVCLNDEIHAAREVTKTSNGRLQTFKAPDFGALGHADGDRVVFYRKPVRTTYPHTEFALDGMDAMPRVDISYSYAGSDGTAIRAFVAAGAKGIVGAAFAPGLLGPDDMAAMKEAAAQGVRVVLSSRAGSGRVFGPSHNRAAGFLQADNLNPQKARILLALALSKTNDLSEIQRIFNMY